MLFINQSINQISIAPISPVKPGSVAFLIRCTHAVANNNRINEKMSEIPRSTLMLIKMMKSAVSGMIQATYRAQLFVVFVLLFLRSTALFP